MARSKKKEAEEIVDVVLDDDAPEKTTKKFHRETFIFYEIFFKAYCALPNLQLKNEFMMAICQYAFYNIQFSKEATNEIPATLEFVKGQLNHDRSKWFTQLKNGSKGGRPKKEENQEKPNETQQNPIKPNETLNDYVYVNDNVNENEDVYVNDNVDFDNTKVLSQSQKENIYISKEKDFTCHLNRPYKDLEEGCSKCVNQFKCTLPAKEELAKSTSGSKRKSKGGWDND